MMALLANAGTAMMWMPLLHLSIGNIVIAVVEALLVWAVLRQCLIRCFWIMLVANYASAALGFFLRGRFNDLIAPVFGEPDIFNANARLAAFAAAAFVLTLLVEAPFTLWLAKRAGRRVWWGFAALLIANAVSYTGLAVLYSRASAQTLLVTLTPVRTGQYVQGDDAYEIWYLDAQTHRVHAVGLDGVHRQQITQKAHPDATYLAVLADEDSVIASSVKNYSTERVVALPESSVATADEGRVPGWHGDIDARRFPGLAESVKVWVGEWAGRTTYLWDEGPPRRELLELAHENALESWRIAYATVLPDTRLVFQLGRDQICVAAPDQKTVALIARGSGPIVIRKSKAE
jgi:hypothetical protein